MNYQALLNRIPDERSAIKFLIEHGILDEPKCALGHVMRLQSGGGTKWRWECNPCAYKEIDGCRRGVRVNNWLEDSKLSFTTIVKFIYLWAHGQASDEELQRELGMYSEAAVDWRFYMRQVCAWRAVQDCAGNPIGGPSKSP